MIAHLVDAAEPLVFVLAVHHLDADGDAFVFRVAFHSIEEGCGVFQPLLMRHSLLLAADTDDVFASAGGALIDPVVKRLLQLVVEFLSNHAVFKTDRAGATHGGNQAIFLQCRPVVRSSQIDAVGAEARNFAAQVLERHHRIEVRAHRRLLDASFARNLLDCWLSLRTIHGGAS